MKSKLSALSRPLIIGGLGICAIAGLGLWKSWSFISYEPVTASINTCEIVKDMNRTSGAASPAVFWTIKVEYEYVVNGQRYLGTEYSNVTPSSRASTDDESPLPSDELLEVCLAHSTGSKHTAMYDPKNPSHSVLVLKLWAGWWLWLFGLPMLAGGLLVRG